MDNMENKDIETIEAEKVEEVVETVEAEKVAEAVEAPAEEAAPAQKKKANVLAILSLVAGILGIIFDCCCGWLSIPFGIGAFILALVSPKNENGKRSGMAVAGLICGIVSIVLFVGSMLITIFFPALGGMMSSLFETGMMNY